MSVTKVETPERAGRRLTLDDIRGESFLTVAECAVLLKLSETSVVRSVQSGQLAALRFGSMYRILAEPLLRLVDAATDPPAAKAA